MSNLKLPKKERPIGLYLHCNKHKRLYANDSLVKCKCDNLVYKCKIHIPGTDDKCKTKNLEAKNLDDALIEFRAFKKELIGNSFQTVTLVEKEQKPVLFVDCVEVFMAYMRDEGVPHHNKQHRTNPVIRQAERALIYFGYALKENGIDPQILKFTDINDKMVGYINEYILETKHYSNKTFNHLMYDIKRFMKYVISKYKLDYVSPFAEIKKRKTVTQIKSISMEEFTNLLALVTPENSVRQRKERKKGENFYKNWFVTAFKLGLYTGGRREEVVKLKWNGIKLTSDGDLSHIEIEHFKKNRANRNIIGDGELENKDVPINKDLEKLLIELGYEENKNKDKYILSPEETCSRKNMMTEMSYAFNRYYALLKTGEVKQFKHLRKTYITALYIKKGDKVNDDTGHEGMDVLHNSYIDKKVVLEAKRKELKKLGSLFEDL
ncbi:MAG: hypothetical protein V4608_09865 [Bacteroidota bacterium]